MSAVPEQLNSLANPATPHTDRLTAMLADIRAARQIASEEDDAWARHERDMQDRQDAVRWGDDDESDEVAA